MNTMTNVKNIKKLSEEELKGKSRISWHEQYRSSAWVFIGGLPFDLTEGDIICVFSQYGELMNINLVRDKYTGKSKGFCFICYEDQRSTDLAVDNLNGIKVLGRTIRVDHVANYKPPKNSKDEQMKMAPKVYKETSKKTKFNGEEDFSRNKVFKDCYELNRRKKKKKEKYGEKDFSYEKGNEIKKQIKNLNFKSLNPENSSSLPYSSSSSSSSFSSSSSSSSPSEEEEEEEEKEEKIKTTKSNRNQKQKKNRTIEDLKREARLIQAELKRRQRTGEATKKSFHELDEKDKPKKKPKYESNEKNKKGRDSRITQEKMKSFEREYNRKKKRERNRSRSVISRVRRCSRTPESHLHL